MPDQCPVCGAHLGAGADCQTLFDNFLVLEFTDPAYGEVHMLTVACFMIQHGRYSDEALTWIEQKLRENLEGGKTSAQIRQEAARETGQGVRSWKILRPAAAPGLPKIAWSMTIADVAARNQDAESYCALVREWARITLLEMKPWLSGT